MSVNLKTEDGIIEELEFIVNGVESGTMSDVHAKIRLFASKNAVRIMALRLIRQRFLTASPQII